MIWPLQTEGCYSPWRKKHRDFCSTLPAPAPQLSYPWHNNNFTERERKSWTCHLRVARTSPSPTFSWQEHSGVFDPPNHPLEVTGSPTPFWRSFQAPTWKRFWHSSTSGRGEGQSPRPRKMPSSYQSPRPTSLGGWWAATDQSPSHLISESFMSESCWKGYSSSFRRTSSPSTRPAYGKDEVSLTT